MNADGINGNDLPFIPADATQITLVDPTQFTALSNFIDGQSCLREARGGLLRRNACRNPWQNYLNARFGATIPTVGTQGLELSLDLFNVLNFIDRDWGLYKQVSEFENGPRFLNAVGFDAANNRPIYTFAAPAVIETTVYGENPSRRPGRCEPVALDTQLGAKIASGGRKGWRNGGTYPLPPFRHTAIKRSNPLEEIRVPPTRLSPPPSARLSGARAAR